MASLETLSDFVFQPSGKDVGSKLKKIGPIDEIEALNGIFSMATIGDLTVTGLLNGFPVGDIVFLNAVQTLTNKSLVDSSTFIVDAADATRRIGFNAAGTTGTTTTLDFAQTANRVVTFPNATDTLVARSTTDTLSNKFLVDSSTFIIDSIDSTRRMTVSVAGLTGTTTTLSFAQTTNRILTFPDATDTIVARTTSETLSNKSLVDTSTFIVDVTDSTKRIGFDAAGTTGTTTTMAFSQTANRLLSFPDVTDTMVARTTTDTLSNKFLVDTTTFVVDATDSTKRIGFSAGGATGTATTMEFAQTANRLLTFPDATDTIVARATTDTLSNKSLRDTTTFIVNSTDSTKRIGFTSNGNVGTTTTMEFAQTANRVLIFPDANDVIVARTTTDTLSNKFLVDNAIFVVNSGDPTRRLVFNVAGNTGTTSTLVTSQTVSTQYVLPDTAGITANFIIAETAQTITGMKTFPGTIFTAQVANPGGIFAANTIWIETTTGHAFRGSVDLEATGVTGPVSSTDNAIVRFDGTTGQIIKNSTVILENTDRISRNSLASTLLYEVSGSFLGGGTTLSTIVGSGNMIFGPGTGTSLTSATGNTMVGVGVGPSITSGLNNTLYGNTAGSAYASNETNNVIVGRNSGVVGDFNTTRIGSTQTRAFIAGIYGITPAGPTQYAIIDSSGQIGSATLPATTTTASGTLSSVTPAASTSYNLVKVGNSVTLQINAVTPTVAGSQATITFSILPVGFRPAITIEFAIAFMSGGVYDTGLVGTIEITSSGSIIFHRDRSGVQQFTGASGIALGWSAVYIAP